MNVYVYRIDDHHYGAGFLRRACEQQGEIVEVWPIKTKAHAKHLRLKGTKFTGAYDRVKALAEIAEMKLMDIDDAEYDAMYEGLLMEINNLPFWDRVKAGWRIIRGKYTEKVNASEKTD